MTHDAVAVHPLVSPWGRFGLYSFYIDAPEPAIVDTGIASSPAEGMAPALEAIGRRIEDVRWILLTHGHIDHVGGAHALWELTGSTRAGGDPRGRRAHAALPAGARGRVPHRPRPVPGRPRGRGEGDGGRGRRHLRRDGTHPARQEGRPSPSAGTSPCRCTRSRATPRDRSPTSSTDSARCSPATPSRCTGRPTASPATPTRPPTARALSACGTRSVPATSTSGTPTAAPTAPRTASGSTRRRHARPSPRAWRSNSGSPAAACRCLEAGLTETDSPYSPFAPVAEELGYTGDPALEPSPFFTSLDGYRRHHEQHV